MLFLPYHIELDRLQEEAKVTIRLVLQSRELVHIYGQGCSCEFVLRIFWIKIFSVNVWNVILRKKIVFLKNYKIAPLFQLMIFLKNTTSMVNKSSNM